MYQPRTYRGSMFTQGMTSFTVSYKETDLWISVGQTTFSPDLAEKIFTWVRELRFELDDYITCNPAFQTSLTPIPDDPSAPVLAQKMIQAAQDAGVGPMAAVAGAFSQEIGERLHDLGISELIVENGGDIYLTAKKDLTIGIYAGNSPLSNKVGITVQVDKMPLGICTSAGTVGHSLSFGKADAVMVLSPSTYHADAYATAIGNMVSCAADISKALSLAETLPKLHGIVIVIGDKLGAWGDIELKPL